MNDDSLNQTSSKTPPASPTEVPSSKVNFRSDDPNFAAAQAEIDQLLNSIGETGDAAEFKKDVRMLPKHGVFFRWPDQGDFEWVHPDDRGLIQSMIPGSRIFCRDQCDDPADRSKGYYAIQYGGITIRVKPAMWLHVDHEGYQVGDRIEVKSKHGKHTPVIGNIHEIEYDPIARRTTYRIEVNQIPLRKKFFKEDIRPCRRLRQPLSSREIEMLNQQQR
jgi:hypothetical protein